jgi:hypothetical protein
MVYNGLDRSVTAALDGSRITLAAGAHGELPVPRAGDVHIGASTEDGQLIESFDQRIEGDFEHYVYNIAAASPLVEWTAVYGGRASRPDRNLGAPRWTTTTADVLFTQPPESIDSSGSGGTRTVLSGVSGQPPYRLLPTMGNYPAADLIRAHARWDSLQSHYIYEWLTLASRGDIGLGIVRARLQESPRSPFLLRLEQDFATPEARPSICQRHTALLAAYANDANLQYVADRCLEPASARAASVMKHYGAAPANPWLALAAGFALADSSDWKGAAGAFDRARKALPEMSEFVAIDVARIRRLFDGERTGLVDVAGDSLQLRNFLQLETGKGVDGPYLAYAALVRGDFAAALTHAAGSEDVQRDISLLVAASDGGESRLRAEVLARPVTDESSRGQPWFLLGLASRERRDTSPYRAAIIERNPDSKEFLSHFEEWSRGSPALFESRLTGLDIAERGYAYAAAVILLADDAPAVFRERAKRLLFAVERPFFK